MANMHVGDVKCGWKYRWSEQEDEIIKNYYKEYGPEKIIELGLLNGRNVSAIQQRASKLGIRMLEYDFNYFEVINTEDKAYWLGFLYADGYVTTNNRWGVELSIVDYDHLEKLKNNLQSNIKISTRTRVTNFQDGSTSEPLQFCSIFINNSKMYKDLTLKGITRDKTFELKFPTKDIVPDNLMRHFIRGFFDGDGTFVMRNYIQNGYVCTAKEISAVCASKHFFEDMQQFIKNNAGINFSLVEQNDKSRKNTLYSLRIYSKENLIDFIFYLYEESTIYLDRKHQKSMDILDYCLT